MSAINAHNNRNYHISNNHADNRRAGTRVIEMPFNGSDLDLSDVSAVTVFGYLLALISVAVLLLTGQPPWFLLTAVAAFTIAQFLPKGLDVTGSRQR